MDSIHPKSESPGSPDSANYLNFPQNNTNSLRTPKKTTLPTIEFCLKEQKDVSKYCAEMP